jgi:hypothetical protein
MGDFNLKEVNEIVVTVTIAVEQSLLNQAKEYLSAKDFKFKSEEFEKGWAYVDFDKIYQTNHSQIDEINVESEVSPYRMIAIHQTQPKLKFIPNDVK